MSLHQGVTEKPRPRISPDNKPFWDACQEEKLVLPFCEDCGKPHLVPGPVCPFCFSDRLQWREATGRGTISTFVIVHKVWFPAFAADVPYNVVQVELEEGPRLTAKLVGEGSQSPAVGDKVQVAFQKIDDDLTLPCFRKI
ncbi:Zn-ribbon domain-containing OB-fold protein [Limoniibacter endophyticus]|uniref:OB-fold protein n=1 Tax=Limoniibacter endophyticus TaxID=1565040 RepID=A0A8J3DUG5_9HYPH|nr:OB-fold domain-containing protein [Limoniibacter endophyticus]GHC78136.1 hypothetical protein GCM10010136_29830 [Limoniibacter endophyticus]